MRGAILLAALVMIGCDEGADAPDPPPQEMQASLPRLSESARARIAARPAFAAVFAGNPVVHEGERDWTFEPAALLDLGSHRVLVSTAEGDGSHPSKGLLAIDYLAGGAGPLHRLTAPRLFVEGNDFGSPPDWTLRRDLLGAPVLAVSAYSGGMGLSCTWLSLVRLDRDRPRRVLGPMQDSVDNTGGFEITPRHQVSFEIHPSAIPVEVQLRYQGDRTDSKTYRLDGDHLVSTQPDPPLRCS